MAAGAADTECVNLPPKPNRQMLRAPVTFPGTMHTVYHFVNKLTMAAIPPLWRMRPLTIAITPLLVRLPSICVTSKRPYQCCWCRSRKCTPLLPISQDSGSSIRKHVPNYTLLYWYYSLFFERLLEWEHSAPEKLPGNTISPFLARQVYDHLSGDETWRRLQPRSISVKNKLITLVTLARKMVEQQAKQASLSNKRV